jgi:hypothetical protein
LAGVEEMTCGVMGYWDTRGSATQISQYHNPDEPEPTSKTISGKTILLIVSPVIVLHFVFCFNSKDFTFKIPISQYPITPQLHYSKAAAFDISAFRTYIARR